MTWEPGLFEALKPAWSNCVDLLNLELWNDQCQTLFDFILQNAVW